MTRMIHAPFSPVEMKKVSDHLLRLAAPVTRPTYGFQVLRRERDNGDIEYQIFADTEPNGEQIAWVQSTRHDAEFIAACLAQAPLFESLIGSRDELLAVAVEAENWFDNHGDEDDPGAMGLLKMFRAAIAKAEGR